MKKKKNIFFVLIDHGIRTGSGKEAKAVKSLLKKKNINLTILKNKEKIKKQLSYQEQKKPKILERRKSMI